MYKFKNEIHEFQTFVKEHLNMFKLRLIKEQLYVNTGNYIDMLCINENNEYVIVELKLNAKVKIYGKTAAGVLKWCFNESCGVIFKWTTPKKSLKRPKYTAAG